MMTSSWSFPQSGERILGRANLRAMREVYPSTLTFTIMRLRGSGDFWITGSVITYGGKPSNTVTIMEFRDGNVAHETINGREPWGPPARRAMGRGSGVSDRTSFKGLQIRPRNPRVG